MSVLVLLLAACQEATVSGEKPTANAKGAAELNWVQSLGLRATQDLEIESIEGGATRVWGDRERIKALLDEADHAARLEPRDRCMASFRLTFSLGGGKTEAVFLTCSGDLKAISGNQGCWKDGQVRVSSRFLQLLDIVAAP